MRALLTLRSDQTIYWVVLCDILDKVYKAYQANPGVTPQVITGNAGSRKRQRVDSISVSSKVS
jgi:hypothetical protein